MHHFPQSRRTMLEISNNTCSYSATYKWIIEVSHCSLLVSIILSVLAITSNLLTILVLRRVKFRSSTENLLLAIAATDLLLPLIHMARYLIVFFHRDNHETLIFLSWHFFLWQFFYLCSILFTLVLATRRYIAIDFPHLYQTLCGRKNTRRATLATFILSAALVLPLPIYAPDYGRDFGEIQRLCINYVPREVLYYSLLMKKVYLSGDYRSTIIYWLYILFFQLLSPFVLAILSFKFARALSKKMTSSRNPNSKLVQATQKTKLILIVSLLVLLRDLPLGLCATYYIFFSPFEVYLATIRLLTKELTIVMSGANFVVLYCTNRNFKEAVPHFIYRSSQPRNNIIISNTSDRFQNISMETRV